MPSPYIYKSVVSESFEYQHGLELGQFGAQTQHSCLSQSSRSTLIWNKREIKVSWHFLAVKSLQAQHRTLKLAIHSSEKVLQHHLGQHPLFSQSLAVLQQPEGSMKSAFTVFLVLPCKCLIPIESSAKIKNSNNVCRCGVHHQRFTN